MSAHAVTRANLERSYEAIDGLYSGLSDDEWAIPSLCPGWTARDILIHLAGVEAMLLDFDPKSLDDPIPFEKVGDFGAAVSELAAADLLGRGREVIAARRAQLGAMSDDDFDRPSMTPIGPGTYGRFMDVRVFDFWVHERDVRLPLDRPTDDSGPAAERALDEVHMSLGYIVGKKVGLPDGKSITFHLTGPVERDLHAVVDGRAQVVETLDRADVTVATDSTTFIMLACGRIDPQQPIDAGTISWVGDAELGERAARNLRFTM